MITNDVILRNRKNRPVVSHQHFSFMVQCPNEEPVFRDKVAVAAEADSFCCRSPSASRGYRAAVHQARTISAGPRCWNTCSSAYRRRWTMTSYRDLTEMPRGAGSFRAEQTTSVLAFWNEVKKRSDLGFGASTVHVRPLRGWCKEEHADPGAADGIRQVLAGACQRDRHRP